MDYLQYYRVISFIYYFKYYSFKPYYKWITFNTLCIFIRTLAIEYVVLNLIINGLPSILRHLIKHLKKVIWSFKPYYKWITFNTKICGFQI